MQDVAREKVFDAETGNVTDGARLKNLSTNEEGIYFAGNLPYGTYYIKEHGGNPEEERVFLLTVEENRIGYNDRDEETRRELVSS